MIELECACDGGKDSLSMAAAAGGETVMAPGNLVVSAYVGCPDVTKVRRHPASAHTCVTAVACASAASLHRHDYAGHLIPAGTNAARDRGLEHPWMWLSAPLDGWYTECSTGLLDLAFTHHSHHNRRAVCMSSQRSCMYYQSAGATSSPR
jgi:hypothetical protein